MNKTLIQQAAAQLRAAEENRRACNPLRNHFSEALAELNAEQRLQAAYAIKQHNHNYWCEHKQSTGVKIGMSSAFVQELFGITEPDYGHLYQDMQLELNDPLPLSQLIAPKLEVEWALKLARDITRAPSSIEDLMGCVDEIALAFEIVDSRISHWDVQAFDLIADNGSSSKYLLSRDTVKPDQIDLLNQPLSLRRNGELVSEVSASESLGNPWEFAHRLVSKSIEMDFPLRRGDLLLTGTLTPIQDIGAEETWLASAPGFTEISLSITQ
ncbi:MAG: 2-keto-4-pentenoate hydratase [Cellvibrionaceae bacterium]